MVSIIMKGLQHFWCIKVRHCISCLSKVRKWQQKHLKIPKKHIFLQKFIIFSLRLSSKTVFFRTFKVFEFCFSSLSLSFFSLLVHYFERITRTQESWLPANWRPNKKLLRKRRKKVRIIVVIGWRVLHTLTDSLCSRNVQCLICEVCLNNA